MIAGAKMPLVALDYDDQRHHTATEEVCRSAMRPPISTERSRQPRRAVPSFPDQ
jgi:hypothetical protein